MPKICALILLGLVGGAERSQSLPPPIEATDCTVAAPAKELPNARYVRKGGRTTASKVSFQSGVLTVKDVAQGRDLHEYETLTLTNPKPMTVVESKQDPTLSRARMFIWQHWNERKQGYLILTLSSVDATSTSHIFVEPDKTGRWRVSWRMVRHTGRVDDLPTYYSMQWVIAAGFRLPGKPLPDGQQPDPSNNRLEFRDKCGDVEQSF
ncbi:MAG: hypothetical protein DMG92_15950 [Acidobacteria bacterium]|nr:MAG: hypothetical protein DMG92_15950 [Acidobacteriota bacterium]